MPCETHETDDDEGADDCEACEKSDDIATYRATIYSRDARISELEAELAAERDRWSTLRVWAQQVGRTSVILRMSDLEDLIPGPSTIRKETP
jgi:hypothetical protein